jgi:hypothetical protein
MWILLAIFAGALLAAYGFFVWRYVKRRREGALDDKKDQTCLLGRLRRLYSFDQT